MDLTFVEHFGERNLLDICFQFAQSLLSEFSSLYLAKSRDHGLQSCLNSLHFSPGFSEC